MGSSEVVPPDVVRLSVGQSVIVWQKAGCLEQESKQVTTLTVIAIAGGEVVLGVESELQEC